MNVTYFETFDGEQVVRPEVEVAFDIQYLETAKKRKIGVVLNQIVFRVPIAVLRDFVFTHVQHRA